MRKLALLMSLAMLAVGHGPVAQAAPACFSIITFQCVWTFRGDYVIRGYENVSIETLEPVEGGPPKGALCIDVIRDLRAAECILLDRTPISNALGETYLMSGVFFSER